MFDAPPFTSSASASASIETFEPIEFDDMEERCMPRERDEPNYLPTPDEIAAACVEIRAGWSTIELLRRHIGPRRNN